MDYSQILLGIIRNNPNCSLSYDKENNRFILNVPTQRKVESFSVKDFKVKYMDQYNECVFICFSLVDFKFFRVTIMLESSLNLSYSNMHKFFIKYHMERICDINFVQ